MQRREFNQHLQRSAIALALSPWLRAAAAPAEKPRAWHSNPFALGVASGRPRADSLVLWTRLLFGDEDRAASTEALRVKVEVFADAALKHRVQETEAVTDEARGHSVHVHLQHLQPSTHYWYRFRQGNAHSVVGHTRTAPALNADVRELRIALTSCQHYEQGQYIAHAEIAKQQLDFVLFMGDYIYESSNAQYAPSQTQRRRTQDSAAVSRTLRAIQTRSHVASRPRRAPVGADVGRPRGGQRLRQRPRSSIHRS